MASGLRPQAWEGGGPNAFFSPADPPRTLRGASGGGALRGVVPIKIEAHADFHFRRLLLRFPRSPFDRRDGAAPHVVCSRHEESAGCATSPGRRCDRVILSAARQTLAAGVRQIAATSCSAPERQLHNETVRLSRRIPRAARHAPAALLLRFRHSVVQMHSLW
jgi:hypothetical protein